MQIKKKITAAYILLSGISALLLCVAVYFLFKRNNEYYFLKRLDDRAKIVASIHYQNDPEKARYYADLKKNALLEMIEEDDYVLKVNDNNTFEYNPSLQLPPEFYTEVLAKGKAWIEENYRYHYGLLIKEPGQKFIVIVTARDRRGNVTTGYILRILIIGSACFIVVAFFIGRFFAKRVLNPVSRITKEANRITASNLHNRVKLPGTDDTDEITQLALTFNNMLDRLETSFEIQANFINNASHELRTPITTIIAESEIALLKERTPEEYEATLGSIYRQAHRLGSLTESLLKLTQTGYDGQKQVQDVARIDELLMDVKSDLDRLYPENRVTIRLDEMPDDETALLLPCNKPLLELAIGNIITNAIKYSDNEEVFVTLNADSNNIKVTITDIGIGIPPEDIPYLYEPFFRGKEASRYIGYGLGLPLAMKIIRMHNGELAVHSETGKGTIVSILFKNKIRNSNVKS